MRLLFFGWVPPTTTIALSILALVFIGQPAGAAAGDRSQLSGVSADSPVARPLEGLLSLEEAVVRGLEHHTEVRGAQIRVAAAERVVRGAGAPAENPSLSIQAGPRFTEGGVTADLAIALEVPIEGGGAVRHRRAASAASLEAARSTLVVVELAVSSAIRIAFADAVAGDGRAALAEEAFAVAKQTERVARRRHEVGEVSVLEPNFASLERAEAEGDLLRARQARVVAYQSLRATLWMSAGAPLSLSPPARPVWPVSRSADLGALVAGAEAVRGDLLAAHHTERLGEADLRAARAAAVSGLAIGAGLGREGNGTTLVSGGLTVELPLQRNQAGVAYSWAASEATRLERASLEQEVPRQVILALLEWQSASENLAIAGGEARGLAEENLRLASRAYDSGKEGFLTVLLFQRQALAARGTAIDAEAELHRAAARLELALGEEIFR